VPSIPESIFRGRLLRPFVLLAAILLRAAFPTLHAAGTDQHSFTPSHDAFIQRGSPNSNAGTGDEFLVKRDSATVSGGSDRIAYLRFSTAAPYAVVDSASLFITINNYAGDGTTPFTFEVFGLPDGHANESFNETLLTFNTATNATTTMPGSLNPAGLTSLGTFTPSVASGGTRVEFTSTALRDFIAASGNSELTFIVFRQTPNAGLPTYFASSEDASSNNRPTLLIRTSSDSLAVTATTASSTLAGSAATNATDSNFTTRWIANADTSSTKSWITLDLGSPQTVNRLNFIAYQHGRSYKLESSDNNSSWSLITTDFRSGVGSGVNPLQQDTNRYFQPRTARYFRLSSLTSTSGNSLSLWEIKLYNDPAAAPTLARHASLTTSVAALPNSSNPEQLKRVVLELALERAQACLNIGDFSAANLLLDDAQNNLTTPAATMAAVATGVTQVRAIRPLIETTPATNPYLKRINDGAALYLTTTDLPWEKNTPELNVFADFNLARNTAADMDALLWVFAHPNSGLRHHPEILRRLLRRTYAYLDAINVHGPLLPAGQLASFYDDFASAPASIVFREFQVLYPGLIPANSNNEWDNAMTTAANNLWAAFGNRNASWVNTDVAIAVELHNLGMKTGRQELIDKGRYFIDDVLTSGRMFADGAVGYIGTQNEAGGYQGTVASYVNRYYQITGRPQALEILRKMEWYGPINGRMIDWWTSPSWKHAWNFISGSGQTGESTNGKNPYTRAGLDASIAAAATATNWAGSTSEVGWYESGTTALTAPDTYTVFDRNIQGPRSWQGGLWNTTGTLRAINDNESGHHTIMGAQVMDPDPNFRVNASVMGVFPRIRTATGGSRDTDNTFAEARHAWLTSKLTGESTVTPDFTALAASHKIHVYASSTKGTEHDWTARQVWLNLPDRSIGLLELSPNANLTAYEVQGAIRLGYGGTAYSSTKTLASTGTNAWSYGKLRIKLHDHNYAEVAPEQYFFRVTNAPITEITLRDQVGGGSNNTPVTYTAGTRWKYITEFRPDTTSDEVTVTEVAEAGGLIGLNVEYPSGNKRYRMLYNPGSAAVVHTPALNWPGTLRIHRSGQHFRPDWVPDPTGNPVAEYLTSGQSVTLDPKAHVVLELVPFPTPDVSISSPTESATLPDTSLSLRCTASVATPGTPLVLWSKLSGPGSVVFEDPASLDTYATFSTPGLYQLQCTATLNGIIGTAVRSVNVATPTEITLRQGVGGYSQETTTIRADNPTWNAGARNQFIVGRIGTASSAARGLLSFDLTTIPAGAVIQEAALDLTTSNEGGSGTVSQLELRALTADFTEGSGSGTSSSPADPNTNSGANWNRRSDATANLTWTNTGGSLGTTILSTLPGYNAATGTNATKTFSSSPGFVAAAQSAIISGRLDLTVVSPLTEAIAAANFTRIHSDDAITESTRPALRLIYHANSLPTITPGSAPAAVSGQPAPLAAAVTDALNTLWSLVSGPGTATFANASQPATNVTFSQPGTYQLRLGASNPFGESSRMISVTAIAPLNPAIFADWQQLVWPGVTDSNTIGPAADPDHDGLGNFLEWALHLDATVPDTFHPTSTKDGAFLEYTYTRRKTAPGEATLILEWSDTLGNDWSTVDVTTHPPLGISADSESVRCTLPAGSAGKRFIRLRVSPP
jgi:hypothetical protein